MPNTDSSNRGGSHEQHAKAGQQGHRNDDNRPSDNNQQAGSRGGTHEQHVKAGQQSHKNS